MTATSVADAEAVPARTELLGQSLDRIHFDEAWYGYAPLNPMYDERHGLHGDPSQYPLMRQPSSR